MTGWVARRCTSPTVLLMVVSLVFCAAKTSANIPNASSQGLDRQADVLPQHPESPNRLRLVLNWLDGHRLFPFDPEGVVREVESIFSRLGVKIHWRWNGKIRHDIDSETLELNIVLMPSDPSGPTWNLGKNTMGVFVVPDTSARSHFLYIFFPNIVRILGLAPVDYRVPSLKERGPLSRVTARVIAHEIIHAVAPGTPHSEEGLMRASLDHNSLLNGEVTIDPRSQAAFVSGLRQWELRNQEARASSLALAGRGAESLSLLSESARVKR